MQHQSHNAEIVTVLAPHSPKLAVLAVVLTSLIDKTPRIVTAVAIAYVVIQR